MPEIVQSGFSRVWTIEGGASPANTPMYQGLMKIGDPTVPRGDIKRIEIPDPNRADEFIEAAEVKGAVVRPTVSIVGRYPMDVSTLLKFASRGCAFDVQAHFGKCRNPSDFNQGWEKVGIWERARVKQWAAKDFGALGSDERKESEETADLDAKNFYEVVRLTFAEQAAAAVTREIISIDVCDAVTCGDCGPSSDGCQVVLATQVGAAATPGASPAVIYTFNGGLTWAGVNITSLLGNEPPSDSECLGTYFVVTSLVDEDLHYARVSDILLGAPNWVAVTTGFVFGKGPNAIVSAGPSATWLAANGGYIYFTPDPTQGVVAQEVGGQTVQNLTDIDAVDTLNVVAVGASNTVMQTDNGGSAWRLITGPAAGQTLTSVKMVDANIWLIGATTGLVATLWVTYNQGVTWSQVTLPAVGARVDDIKFPTKTVGYLSLRVTGARSLVLRSIDGGRSWYVLPEGPGQIPNNTRVNQLAVCTDPNIVFGGGLSSGGSDGFIVKAS